MDVKNLFLNKAYLFPKIEEDKDGKELVEKILKKEGFWDIKTINHLSTNFNYDAFYAEANNMFLIVKVSFDEKTSCLFDEFDLLSKSASAWKPAPIAYNTMKVGDTIVYSIQSCEFAENVEQVGRGIIWENLESFLACLYSFQYHKTTPSKKFNDYLKEKVKDFSDKKIPEEVKTFLKNQGQYDQFKEIVDSLKKEILKIQRQNTFDSNQFVHGNLKLSNILIRDGFFKLINFTESYSGNSFFDIAALTSNMDLDFNQEKHLFTSYLKLYNKNFSIEAWQEYKTCYDAYLRIYLLDLIFSYIKEVYILDSSRPLKINKIVSSFILNSKRFSKINSAAKHMEFLYSFILEPIIGSKNDG